MLPSQSKTKWEARQPLSPAASYLPYSKYVAMVGHIVTSQREVTLKEWLPCHLVPSVVSHLPYISYLINRKRQDYIYVKGEYHSILQKKVSKIDNKALFEMWK